MKAIFLKKTKYCIGLVSHCRDGEEGSLLGFKQDEIIVKELPRKILDRIDDPNNSDTFRNLFLTKSGKVSILEVKSRTSVLNVADVINFPLEDQSVAIEIRFNKLLEILKSKSII